MGPLEAALPDGPPDSVEGWRAAADALLSPPCCTFHRNMEISSRYAWLRTQQPTSLKWAGMAAIASHHVRLVLFPFRLDADRSGYVNLPRSLSRRLLTEDANRMREVNNAIYHDIFWVHLAYLSSLATAGGVADLRRLLSPHPEHEEMLAAFETIDAGRVLLSGSAISTEARAHGEDLVWAGNLALLDHEQRMVVQPFFDQFSGRFARLASLGATTSFEVRGLRREIRYFTSFLVYSLTTGLAAAVRARMIPSITRYDDRWRWLEGQVVPAFRRLDGDADHVHRTLVRVVEDSTKFAAQPCLVPNTIVA